MPGCERFGPKGMSGRADSPIDMTLDEYETIRLIDREGLTQEQCALQMGVARTTAQAIYNSARAKLADCLVSARELRISGGDYVLCDRKTEACGCHCHCGKRCRQNEKNTEEMK